MAIVRVPCIDCGDREVAADDCSVRVNPWQDHGYVVFPCDGCEKNIERTITPEGVSLLVDAGVRLYIPERSDEFDERASLLEGDAVGFRELSRAFKKIVDAQTVTDLWDDFQDEMRDIKNV